jgi:exosortase
VSHPEAPGGTAGPAALPWILAVLLLLVFLPALAGLAEVWSSVEYYSHGFLVPFVSGWLAWRGFEGPRPPRSPDARGWLVLVPALGAYLVGIAASQLTLQGVALVLAVAAAVLLAAGARCLCSLAFPIAFLVFMVPLPPAWITPVIVWLQQQVSSVAVGLLHAFGVPVAREGNVIALPGDEFLFVAEACSGITSIVTLLPIAVLLAHLVLRGLPRQVLLVAAVIPVAMLLNLVRVVATTLAARAWGAQAVTEGAVHDAAGLLTVVASCLLLVGAALTLRGREAEALPSPGH